MRAVALRIRQRRRAAVAISIEPAEGIACTIAQTSADDGADDSGQLAPGVVESASDDDSSTSASADDNICTPVDLIDGAIACVDASRLWSLMRCSGADRFTLSLAVVAAVTARPDDSRPSSVRRLAEGTVRSAG